MIYYKKNKNKLAKKGNRLLISIAVIGSTGPIRFLVNEHDLVAAVIETALKLYANEERIPVLGSHINTFVLHCPNTRTTALSPRETIGSAGVRNFLLFKQPQQLEDGNLSPAGYIKYRKANCSFIEWLNRSFHLNIFNSH